MIFSARPVWARYSPFFPGRWAFLALALSGCGLAAPFEGSPRAARVGEFDAGPRVGICYNALFTNADKVRKLAQDACGASADPKLASQDMQLTCPLLTPVRASFVCAPD